MKKQQFDYIVCGGGASGLLLCKQLISDSFFKNKTILLIEKENKNTNDRTWCYWTDTSDAFEKILYHKWQEATFKSEHIHKNFSLDPYDYHMIRSGDFYTLMEQQFENAPQLMRLKATVTNIQSQANASLVTTDSGVYQASTVFNSIYDPKPLFAQSRYPVLQQHFLGWFVKTEKACFNPRKMTFMDFSIPQKGETRFVYVLPFSPHEALIEFTLFSANLLKQSEYEETLKNYLQKLDTGDYEIKEEEQGNIPMSCYRFSKHNTKTLLHIGTAGGWTKASTGYTFAHTVEKTTALIAFLKTNKPLTQFEKRTRFWYYDLLFLDVLYKNNALGASLFSIMFKKLQPRLVFKFLSEKTHFQDELKLLLAFPARHFIKALLQRIF